LSELALIVYSNSPNTHHLNNNVWTPTNPQPFVFSMFAVYWHEILPHNTSRTWNFALLPSYMFFANCLILAPTIFLDPRFHYTPCIEPLSISHHTQLQPLPTAILEPTFLGKHDSIPTPFFYASSLDFLGLALKKKY